MSLFAHTIVFLCLCVRVCLFGSHLFLESIASLEKLLGFYAKDPAGAKATKEELDRERNLLTSLRARIAEIEGPSSVSFVVVVCDLFCLVC